MPNINQDPESDTLILLMYDHVINDVRIDNKDVSDFIFREIQEWMPNEDTQIVYWSSSMSFSEVWPWSEFACVRSINPKYRKAMEDIAKKLENDPDIFAIWLKPNSEQTMAILIVAPETIINKGLAEAKLDQSDLMTFDIFESDPQFNQKYKIAILLVEPQNSLKAHILYWFIKCKESDSRLGDLTGRPKIDWYKKEADGSYTQLYHDYGVPTLDVYLLNLEYSGKSSKSNKIGLGLADGTVVPHQMKTKDENIDA